jgi:hypothetical protein
MTLRVTDGDRANFAIASSRPIADGVLELSRRYNLPLSYEDPPYLFDSDVKDATLDLQGRGKDSGHPARRILVPRGGTIDGAFKVRPDSNSPESAETAAFALIAAQHKSGQGGRFEQRSEGSYLHIVPTSVRDHGGIWSAAAPVPDTVIELDDADRTALAFVTAGCDATSQQSGKRVVLGSGPMSLLSSTTVSVGAHQTSARSAMVAALEQLPIPVTWVLYFSPTNRVYVLNLVALRPREESASAVQAVGVHPFPSGRLPSGTSAPPPGK